MNEYSEYDINKLKENKDVMGLIDVYKETPVNIGEIAIEAIEELNDPRAIKPLIELLQTDKKFFTIRALGNLKAVEAVDNIIGLLDDEMFTFIAIVALGNIGDKKAVKHLIKYLDAPSETDKAIVVESIGNCGDDDTIPLLTNLLSYSSPSSNVDPEWVAFNAKAALKKLNAKGVGNHLIEKINNADNIWKKREYIRALGIWGNPTNVEFLISLLENCGDNFDDGMTRTVIIKSLGRLKDTRALPYLIKCMNNDPMKHNQKEAIDALARINDKSAIDALVKKSNDPFTVSYDWTRPDINKIPQWQIYRALVFLDYEGAIDEYCNKLYSVCTDEIKNKKKKELIEYYNEPK